MLLSSSFAFGVERREALRIKLTFEEVLLEYQAKFGEDAPFRVQCTSRFSTIRVEVTIPGDPFDPMSKDGDDGDVMRGLLAGIGLVPTWSYKNAKNHIVFLSKKKPLSGTVKMLVAMGLALVAGCLLSLLPEGTSAGLNDYLLTPVTNAIMGLISAVSVPLIFLSVLGSICSMGNMETLGKIGRKTLKVIFLYVLVIGFAESCGIPITVTWLTTALITNVLLSFSVPPVPGGMLMGFTIAFTQLGIPLEVMAVALAVDAIVDFLCTACDVSSWQLTMIGVADSLDMLDKETLHKDSTIPTKKA